MLEKGSEEYEKCFAKWKAEGEKYGWMFEYEAEQFFKHVKPPTYEEDFDE